MNASFEEKSVWIQLVSLLVVLGGYFVVAGRLLADGVTELPAFVPLFVVTIVLMVIVIVIGHVFVAVLSRPEPRDERDRLIGWRAESNASWILGAGTFLALNGLVFGFASVWIAHLLLLSLFLSEVASLALQLLYYRRGM